MRASINKWPHLLIDAATPFLWISSAGIWNAKIDLKGNIEFAMFGSEIRFLHENIGFCRFLTIFIDARIYL